jgi:hypothetical protein
MHGTSVSSVFRSCGCTTGRVQLTQPRRHRRPIRIQSPAELTDRPRQRRTHRSISHRNADRIERGEHADRVHITRHDSTLQRTYVCMQEIMYQECANSFGAVDAPTASPNDVAEDVHATADCARRTPAGGRQVPAIDVVQHALAARTARRHRLRRNRSAAPTAPDATVNAAPVRRTRARDQVDVVRYAAQRTAPWGPPARSIVVTRRSSRFVVRRVAVRVDGDSSPRLLTAAAHRPFG